VARVESDNASLDAEAVVPSLIQGQIAYLYKNKMLGIWSNILLSAILLFFLWIHLPKQKLPLLIWFESLRSERYPGQRFLLGVASDQQRFLQFMQEVHRNLDVLLVLTYLAIGGVGLFALRFIGRAYERRLEAVLGDLSAGARVSLVYSRRGEMLTTQLTVEADPTLELVSAEQLGRRPTPAQQRFRDEWLGSKAGL